MSKFTSAFGELVKASKEASKVYGEVKKAAIEKCVNTCKDAKAVYKTACKDARVLKRDTIVSAKATRTSSRKAAKEAFNESLKAEAETETTATEPNGELFANAATA
jgi:DNA-nicking Smr family endonuclease